MSSTDTVLARGNVAVITGGASGIGLTVAERLELGATGSAVGVSVLCPGFVRTDLMDNEPSTAASPIGELMGELFTARVADGIPASDVADSLVDAVDDGRFWILTHQEMRQMPVERMQRAASQINPPMIGTD